MYVLKNGYYAASTWIQDTDGKWYYFNTISDGTRGALFVNCETPDGYRVDAYGCWIP